MILMKQHWVLWSSYHQCGREYQCLCQGSENFTVKSLMLNYFRFGNP